MRRRRRSSLEVKPRPRRSADEELVGAVVVLELAEAAACFRRAVDALRPRADAVLLERLEHHAVAVEAFTRTLLGHA